MSVEKSMACPCCGKELFRLGPLQLASPVFGVSAGSPKLQSDENGQFMCCPHCSKRVVFVSAPALVGAGFRIGDVQPCADCQPDEGQ